jgi:Holliday junction resolvase RusA-like endonuclease
MPLKSLEPELTYLEGNVLVPAKALSYKTASDGNITEIIKPRTHQFENEIKRNLTEEFKKQKVSIFPTKKPVFVSITHGLHSRKEYDLLDLDNRAKTILDALKGVVYDDDRQVRILLTDKVYLEKSSESYVLFSVKFLSKGSEKLLERRMAQLRPTG